MRLLFHSLVDVLVFILFFLKKKLFPPSEEKKIGAAMAFFMERYTKKDTDITRTSVSTYRDMQRVIDAVVSTANTLIDSVVTVFDGGAEVPLPSPPAREDAPTGMLIPHVLFYSKHCKK